MKKIVKGTELRNKMTEGIKLLCGTVKETLGPKGRNVIIDHSSFSPFITNDGVTIASNIESEDPVINTILELTKEASIKTNEMVGDGTTTTLVLLESIFLEGKKMIENGTSPIMLKKEIDDTISKIIEDIKKESKIPTTKDIKNIASISANDIEIGHIISETYDKVGNNIKIKEHNLEQTKINYLKGYFFDTLIASPYFFKENDEIKIDNSKILVTNKELLFIEDISNIINYLLTNNESLILIAKNYSDELINEVLNLYYENDLKLILLKSPSFGEEELNILNDIAILSNTKIVYNLKDINIKNLGLIKNIEIKKDITKLSFNNNEDIENRIIELEDKIELLNDFEKENCIMRLSMLKSGFAEILVGAQTTTERREKKMRYDDALCAVKTANCGIIPGSGLILYKISKNLEIKNTGIKILKEALKMPIIQILQNAGLNYEEILKEVENKNYELIYNVKTNKFEDIEKTKVLDTVKVIINCLKNASSIATMLLTTNSLIINEYKNNLNKSNDFNEL